MVRQAEDFSINDALVKVLHRCEIKCFFRTFCLAVDRTVSRPVDCAECDDNSQCKDTEEMYLLGIVIASSVCCFSPFMVEEAKQGDSL